jgi:hypothetical protein
VIDRPALEQRQQQRLAAEHAQLDAKFAHLGELAHARQAGPPTGRSPPRGTLEDLKARLQNLTSSQPAAHASDPVDPLAKLADLKERGFLTDAEFAAVKAKILGMS